MKKITLVGLAILLSLSFVFTGCDIGKDSFYYDGDYNNPKYEVTNQSESTTDSEHTTDSDEIAESEEVSETEQDTTQEESENEGTIPPYSGIPYTYLNGGIPNFTDEELVTESYEYYSPLDSLGRCGITIACIGKDLMPTDDRESISNIKPSGWVNNRYDTSLVSGGYIYNRSHLIGFQLTGENANERNLITGTRYFNVEGMLPFENMVADYLKEEPENHVMYRVTPIFDGDNLVVHGVQMEAYSVEDGGEGICFNVFIYNVQPGIVIDYTTGNNWLATDPPAVDSETETEEILTDSDGQTVTYVLNTSSKKFHDPSCSSVSKIQENNKDFYNGSREELVADGYSACGICHP